MSNNDNNVDVSQVMKDLEHKVNSNAIKITNIASNTILANPDKKTEIAIVLTNKLVSSMASGTEEFQKKVGRPMTYSEMRSMWG